MRGSFGSRSARAKAVLLAAGLAALAAGPALGRVEHRFPIAGEVEGRGYPRSLAVVATSPDAYVHDYATGTGSVWRGPRARATMRPDLGGDAILGWSGQVLRLPSVRDTALARLTQGWPIVAEGREPVERVVAGRAVGSIDALWVLTKGTGALATIAMHEASVVFPICGRTVHIDIDASAPAVDSAGPYGDFVIEGMRPTDWNRLSVMTTIERLALVGSLPASRVNARSSGRRVVGNASDCNADPVAGLAVRLERRVGRRWVRAASGATTASGSFSLPARVAGTYRAAVGARASAGVRVR